MAQEFGVTILEKTEETILGGHPPIQLPITIATTGAEVTYEAGTVLAKITASGKYAGLNPDGADGTETAAAVLVEEITVGDTDDENTIALFHGEVVKSGLVWTHVGITEAEQDAAYAELQAVGVFAK